MSLRWKIVLAIAGLILLLGLGGTLDARYTASDLLENELQRRALVIAEDLANPAGSLLLTNDAYGLYEQVSAAAQSSADVQYIVVFDSAGNVRASTFAGGLPAGLRPANRVAPPESYSAVTLQTSRGQMLDVAYPIQSGQLGTVRVGLSKERVLGRVDRLTLTLLALTAGILVAGLAVGYLLATALTRPLSRLAAAASAVGRGELSHRVAQGGRDEVSQLSATFNAMADRLKERDHERNELLAKVIAAQEEERKRIARELHDGAGQILTSLLLGLKRLEDGATGGAVRGEVAQLRSLTAETLDLVRDAALELRPSVLDDLGLVAALEHYVADCGRKNDLEADFQSTGLTGVRLKPQTETALYRIAQEAVTNVVRHAHANSVSVLLDKRGDRVVLVVEDDGEGFDIERVYRRGAPAYKLGLLGMEERAALVGGSLTIESYPGSRTAVFVEVPLEAGTDGHNADPGR